MKKLKFLPFLLSLCLVFCLALSPAALALEDPGLESRAAVLIDKNTGKVFYSLNADQLVYPASVTKIMTVLLAVEAVEEETVSIYDSVTASVNMTYDLVEDGSSAGIVVGETMTLEDLLYCAMLSSGNDACNVIAEYISGSIPAFIQRMNERAQELGCSSTHFANTHGLPDVNHYTTAADFSLIAKEAVSHDLFMDLCNTKEATIPATNMNGERQLKNSNALICGESMYGGKYLYEYAAGIKTGFTSDAGYCLASTASNNGIDLLAVVFGGYAYTGEDGTPSYTNFEDSIKLYEWVFQNFSYQEILKSTEIIGSLPVTMGADADSVNVRPDVSLTALLPNDYDASSFERSVTIYSDDGQGGELTAPISAGEVLGEISVTADGVNYGTVKLVAASAVELSRLQYIKTEIRSTLHSKPVVITIWVLLVLAVLYLFLVIRYRVLRARRRKAIRAARAEQARRAAAETPRQAPAPERPAPPPAAPPIRYFTDDAADTAGSGAGTSADDAEAEAERQKAKAERDYFEEFFRQK